jgi:hypothetical protein
MPVNRKQVRMLEIHYWLWIFWKPVSFVGWHACEAQAGEDAEVCWNSVSSCWNYVSLLDVKDGTFCNPRVISRYLCI